MGTMRVKYLAPKNNAVPLPRLDLQALGPESSAQTIRRPRLLNAIHSSGIKLMIYMCRFSLPDKTLVRELPGHVFGDLGVLLNPKSSKNWVTLAGHLGFTGNEVRNFELVIEEATQRVLAEWGQQDGSTVDVLIDVLKKMKRDDCVQVLKQWDS